MSGSVFPVGLCTLRVTHHTIPQPSSTSWVLPSQGSGIASAPCSQHRTCTLPCIRLKPGITPLAALAVPLGRDAGATPCDLGKALVWGRGDGAAGGAACRLCPPACGRRWGGYARPSRVGWVGCSQARDGLAPASGGPGCVCRAGSCPSCRQGVRHGRGPTRGRRGCRGPAQPGLERCAFVVFGRPAAAPVRVPNAPTVAVGRPPPAWRRGPPSCPSPQGCAAGRIPRAKGGLGRRMAGQMGPSPDCRGEEGDAPGGGGVCVVLDAFAEAGKKRLDVWLRWPAQAWPLGLAPMWSKAVPSGLKGRAPGVLVRACQASLLEERHDTGGPSCARPSCERPGMPKSSASRPTCPCCFWPWSALTPAGGDGLRRRGSRPSSVLGARPGALPPLAASQRPSRRGPLSPCPLLATRGCGGLCPAGEGSAT